jgi:hypothetical protein
MYLCNFPITWHIEYTRNQILQEYNFIPVVVNFAQEFSPEGVAFDIFFKKMSNPHPLPDPPTLGVNIDRCISCAM